MAVAAILSIPHSSVSSFDVALVIMRLVCLIDLIDSTTDSPSQVWHCDLFLSVSALVVNYSTTATIHSLFSLFYTLNRTVNLKPGMDNNLPHGLILTKRHKLTLNQTVRAHQHQSILAQKQEN